MEGLLYAGAYILAGAPRSASLSWWLRLPTMSVPGRICGDIRSMGTVLYLALEDDFQRIQSRMFMMYGVNNTPTSTSPPPPERLGMDWMNS